MKVLSLSVSDICLAVTGRFYLFLNFVKMLNNKANQNTQETQYDPAGVTILEAFYGGMSTEELKNKQILSYQIFVAAVSSPAWDEIPPAQRLDMCMLIDELHDTMRACQEVYVEG